MADDFRDTCRDCVHLASWPERAEFAQRVLGGVPDGYALFACMADPCGALAVSAEDSPACCERVAGHTRFRRGKRSDYAKEVEDADRNR